MTVLQTVASLHPDAGGTSRTVRTTCAHLARAGVNVELVTGREPGAPALTPECPDVTTTFAPMGRNTLQDAWSFRTTLSRRVEASHPALIHDNGVWLSENLVSALEAHWNKVPHVVTTHGMLEPWAFNHQRRKKKLAWYGYQREILRWADLVHATAEMEVEHLRELGLTGPIAVIPNGVPLPEQWKKQTSSGVKRQALFLSRIHPKKGLPMLLDAWADLRPSNWHLLIVGPDEQNHRSALEEQAREQRLEEVVEFQGPVSDEDKWSLYRESDLFVLPTHSENFGVVVAEALASGIPVLTTTGAPWAVLEERDCGWWVEPEVDALTQALQEATESSDAQRLAMGNRGRELVEEQFSWEEVARKLHGAYQWIRKGGAPPDYIRPSQ